MNIRDAFRQSMDMGQMVSMAYLEDLTDEEMMHRPAPESNHIKWQVGHLIASENNLLNTAVPGAAPALPEGFAERYAKETAKSDDPGAFDTKADLLSLYREQRDASLAALGKVSDAEFDRETGFDYAPTVGAIFSLLGGHWLMHAGQWAVIRRQLGRSPLF